MIAGYGSGHIRLFSIPDGRVLCEIAAHNGWITGMDLASQSGLLLSCAEDGYVRVCIVLYCEGSMAGNHHTAGMAASYQGTSGRALVQ